MLPVTLRRAKGIEVIVPRRLRIHVAGGFYHVTLRGNHRQDIFRSESDRLLLNAIVARGLAKYDARLHAYCWMSNHLHFLVQVGARPLSNVIRQIASGYARAFQSKLETTGHLFERRYHAVLVDADSYLLELLRYIHLNPVRACVVQRPAQYRWSSHHAYAGGTREEWLTTDFALSMFSSDRRAAHAAYRRFIDEAEPNDLIVDDSAFEMRVTQDHEAPAAPQRSLGEMLEEACQIFGVTEIKLRSISREAGVIRARAWITSQATSRGIATLSAVARFLGKDRATLRHAMRQHGPDD